MQHLYGDYVEIPEDLVYAFHQINIFHGCILIASIVFSDSKKLNRLHRTLRVAIKEGERNAFTLILVGVSTFSMIAFYEYFPYGVVVAFAFFPLIWMARLVIVSLIP